MIFLSSTFGVVAFVLMMYLLYRIVNDYLTTGDITNVDLFIVTFILAILSGLFKSQVGEDGKNSTE